MESQSPSLLQLPLKRSLNFSPAEESLIICCAKKYKHVLENKKTDTNANREKTKCWEQIESEFNAQSGGVHRSSQVLRKKYENLKKTTKKKVSEEKCYRFKTGGGPNADFKFTDVDEGIMDLLGDTRLQGLPTVFGGDTGTADDETIEIVVENDETTQDILFSDTCDLNEKHSSSTSWGKHCGEMLRAPKSKALTLKEDEGNRNNGSRYSKKEKQVTDKISQWAEKKKELQEKLKESCDEEHQLKLKLMQEEHNIKMEILKKESEARLLKIRLEMEQTMKGLKEQNTIKLDILQAEKHQLFKVKNTN